MVIFVYAIDASSISFKTEHIMIKVIGFTKKFYTLWEVSEENNYSNSPYDGKPYVSSVRTFHHFIQNLSFDLENAKVKANTTEFDPTLKGTKSWYTPAKYFEYPILNEGDSTKIFFGKYSGKTLGEIFVSDRNYFDWLKDNTNNSQLKLIIENLPILATDTLTKMSLLEEAISFSEGEDVIEFEIPKNLHPLGNGKYFVNVEVESGYEIKLIFPFASEHYYSGYSFYLPLDPNGKAKRIKGKTLELNGSFDKVQFNYDNMTRRQEFIVNSFKIKK